MQIKFLSLATIACLLAFASASPVNTDSSIDMAAGKHLMRRQYLNPLPPPGKLVPEAEKSLSQVRHDLLRLLGIEVQAIDEKYNKDLPNQKLRENLRKALGF